ncbi:hypothetical protein X375_07890 [Oenococcus oeni S13]|nr:hypothetical protein X375_07890 [Oenococcus oeni S13]
MLVFFLLPFYFLVTALFSRELIGDYIRNYFDNVGDLLLIAFFFVAVFSFILTAVNNKGYFNKFDEEKARIHIKYKNQALEPLYEERFGKKKFRLSKVNLSLKPEQNIGNKEISKLYKIHYLTRKGN